MAEMRSEIDEDFGPWLAQLQFEAEVPRDGEDFKTYGIVCVPDPYTAR